ncbi:AzlD domain-containing protein [Streptomyces sp. NPDC002055]|uniref:AzlD domain-containing protein n=1 Tax=Streptomyces sp. NPDC002055 TaxID=3154534 RepID=UPI00332B33BE
MTPWAVLVLAVGTYALRMAGPLSHGRFEPSERARRMLTVSATVLLFALVATSAVADGQSLAGWARPAGVLVGGALALRRAPFLVAVIAAAATTAVLRWSGVS